MNFQYFPAVRKGTAVIGLVQSGLHSSLYKTMKLPAALFQKSGIYSIASALMITLAGCNGDTTMRVTGDYLEAPVPSGIRQIAALGNLQLEVRISVNNELIRQVPVSSPIAESFSERVSIPAEQDNDIEIAWYAVIGGTRVLLADYETRVTSGTSELNVSSYNNFGSRFDADNDGISNLDEAIENRNLLSLYDLEAPLQTSFGGEFGVIRNDGIDDDLSGEPGEPDQPTTFSLRHDGSDLIVYVCGQDQTLQGDNTASDGQYWHDDVVFIFLDGADSNNSSFDLIDDFQLAFIRDTEQMIVSKGMTNQFCTAGSCISHSFFNNSTSCEYELRVQLPIAELNMSIDTPIGFDIEITDDDNGGRRDSSSAWIGYDDRTDQHPYTFGTIRLK